MFLLGGFWGFSWGSLGVLLACFCCVPALRGFMGKPCYLCHENGDTVTPGAVV